MERRERSSDFVQRKPLGLWKAIEVLVLGGSMVRPATRTSSFSVTRVASEIMVRPLMVTTPERMSFSQERREPRPADARNLLRRAGKEKLSAILRALFWGGR